MVSHLISSLEVGGAENYLLKFIIRQKIISGRKDSIIIIKNKIDPIFNEVIERERVECIWLFDFKKVFSLLKENKFIICWMYHSMIIGFLIQFLFKNIVVWNFRQTNFSLKDSIITKFLVKKILPKISKRVYGILYVTNKSKIIHERLGILNPNSLVISNGYLDHSNKRISNSIKNIGFIARNSPVKNFNLFESIALSLKKKYEFLEFHVY